jgi:hypothetical protein
MFHAPNGRSAGLRKELRFSIQRIVWMSGLILLLAGPDGFGTTVAADLRGGPGVVGGVADTRSVSSEFAANGSSAGGSVNDGESPSELTSKQIAKVSEVLKSSRKGEVHIFCLKAETVLGKQLESAFRDAGWVVATLPIGMGNLPAGITITGKATNVAVAAARSAFGLSGIKYSYRDDKTNTINPAFLGPCDVAITVSTE